MSANHSIEHRQALPADAEVHVSPERIRASFRVPADHPAFQGHFPETPILPGVVLLAWMQSMVRSLIGAPQPNLRCRNLKFLRPVRPGDQLVFDVKVLAARSNFAKIRGQATVDGEVVCEADLMSAMVEE